MDPENTQTTPPVPVTSETIPAQPTPSTQPISPTKKSKLPLVLGILVLLGVVGILVFFSKLPYLGNDSFNVNQPIISINPTPTPTVDPTANWKTYTDDKNGVEFKYPNTWFAKPYAESGFFVFLENHSFEIQTGTEFSTTIQVTYNEITNTQTNKNSFLEMTLAEGVKRVKSGYDQNTVKVINNMLVGGKNATQLSGVLAPGMLEGEYFKETLIQLDGKLLLVILHGKEFESVYDQILSTFKFTDQNQTNGIESWKTYSNSDLAFQYPSSWTVSENKSTITSPDSKMRISIASKDIGLMNECMQQTSINSQRNVVVRKFSRVNAGAACSTTDSTDLAALQAWIVPAATAYSPGIDFQYLSTEKTQSEAILNQIISTFRFL